MIDPVQPAVSLDDFLIDRLPMLAAMPPARQFRILRQYSHTFCLPYPTITKRYLRLLTRAMYTPPPPPPVRRRRSLPRPSWRWVEKAVDYLAWLSDVLHHRMPLEETCRQLEERRKVAYWRYELYSHSR